MLLLLTIVVVILLLLIYYIITKPNENLKLRKLLEESNGTFDEPARRVLRRLNEQDDQLTPAEYAIRGNIIRFNILENPIAVPRDDTNRGAFGHMINNYERAIRGAGRRIDTAEVADLPEFGIILRGALTLHDMFRPVNIHHDEEDEIAQMLAMFTDTVTHQAPVVQRGIIEKRVQNAVQIADNRAEAVKIALMPQYTDDRQNVHDTKINGDLNEILKKIAAPVDTENEIENIKSYIDDMNVGMNVGMNADTDPSNTTPSKIRFASEALNAMARAGYMTTYGDNEAHILALVWKRCSDPRNADNREIMKEAVFDALADCFDGVPKALVCANGRCSRVINSLALIDYDPSINGAMTFEAYRNMILNEAGEIFDNLRDELENGDDKMKSVAASYTDINAVADPEAESEFKDRLRKAIDNMLNNYADKFNTRELENLRQECYVYVTI